MCCAVLFILGSAYFLCEPIDSLAKKEQTHANIKQKEEKGTPFLHMLRVPFFLGNSSSPSHVFLLFQEQNQENQ